MAPQVGGGIVNDVLNSLASIDPQIAGALGKQPQQQLQAVLQASISKVTQHQSHLPPADEAEAWARIYPDAPQRIFDLAERRLRLAERQLDASIEASADTRGKNQAYRLWGLGAGLIVAGGFLVAGTIMTVVGGSVVGGVIVDIFGVGAGMVTAFIHGRPLLDQNTRFRPLDPSKAKSVAEPQPIPPPSDRRAGASPE